MHNARGDIWRNAAVCSCCISSITGKMTIDVGEDQEDEPDWMKAANAEEALQIDKLYDAMDADHDGEVTKIEFVEVREREREKICRGERERARVEQVEREGETETETESL